MNSFNIKRRYHGIVQLRKTKAQTRQSTMVSVVCAWLPIRRPIKKGLEREREREERRDAYMITVIRKDICYLSDKQQYKQKFWSIFFFLDSSYCCALHLTVIITVNYSEQYVQIIYKQRMPRLLSLFVQDIAFGLNLLFYILDVQSLR